MSAEELSNLESDLVKDADNPKSLVNVCPSSVANRIAAIPDELFLMKEEELMKQALVHETEQRLRAAFQIEYERAIRTSEMMDMANIYKGIVTQGYFYKYVVGNSFKLCFMIKPYSDYKADLEDLLQLGIAELRKIMKQPLVTKSGNFDSRLAGIKHKIFQDLADRTRGSAARKLEIDSKSMNLNLSGEVQPQSIADIDQRLEELQAKEVQQISYKDVTDGAEEV